MARPLHGPPILLYHRVCRDDAVRRSEFVVSESVFRAQLGHLARAGYYTPRLSDVIARRAEPPRPGKHPVVLTFDDGYLDNLEVALPVLKEFGFTAAVFPVLGLRARETWWDATPPLRAPLLSPAEMRLMEAAGVEFGSHTLSHAPLTRLPDRELAEELTRSREVLGSIVERPLPVLAYPYGDVDARVKRAARASGYAAALSVHTGPVELDADPFEIRRVCVTNSANEAYLRLVTSRATRLYGWFKWKAKERGRWLLDPSASHDAPGPGGETLHRH